jgi:hypothetical protein
LEKELVLSINFTFCEIDDVLSPNNAKLDVCVDLIYQTEFDIKATTDIDRANPYLEHTYYVPTSPD